MNKYGEINVEVFFDSDGNRTCAENFRNGRVCKYYRTRKFGTHETCLFAPDSDNLERGGRNDLGYLIPGEWCPIGNVCGSDKKKNSPEKDKYYEFFSSVSCLFAEGVEFMTKTEIYDAIKREWQNAGTTNKTTDRK